MVYLIHGENTVASRDYIRGLSDKEGAVLVDFVSTEVSPLEVSSRILSRDLFGNKNVVVLDVTKDKSFDFKGLLEQIQGNGAGTLIFWSRDELPKSHQLLKLSGIQAKKFDRQIKTSVFNFLDPLFDKSRKEAHQKLKELLDNGEDEFEIFSMVVFGARNVALARHGSPSFDKLHPFVKNKASKQAGKFDQERIRELFEYLYQSDLDIKTGRLDPVVALSLVIERVCS